MLINLSNIVSNKYNIEDEMCNANSCLYLTGIGTTKNKLDKLKNALKKVEIDTSYQFSKLDFQPFPLVKVQPYDTFNRDYTYINKNDSILKISNKKHH